VEFADKLGGIEACLFGLITSCTFGNSNVETQTKTKKYLFAISAGIFGILAGKMYEGNVLQIMGKTVKK
jgi:hypothetical protein